MKELVVVSGKGGTGKTSLTASFASLAENMVLCDADVDAADMHLLTAPLVVSRSDFTGGSEAVINPDICTRCGTCLELCRFDAIDEDYRVRPIDCEGCGVCVDLCPEGAIAFPEKICGEWMISRTRFGTMVHARLGIAEENSGKLVTRVRQEAERIAETENADLIITDGPPGVGCPVIASIGGAGAVVIVAEPTVSGLHDMMRAVDLTVHFKVPAMICVNKYDLNPDQTGKIERWTQKNNHLFLGTIPFDPMFVEAMVQGKTLLECAADTPASMAIQSIWQKIMHEMDSAKG